LQSALTDRIVTVEVSEDAMAGAQTAFGVPLKGSNPGREDFLDMIVNET
jgi:hypothetical protein